MITTDEELISRGFKKFNTSAISPDGVKYMFQKRYRDKWGNTLYFMDINKWDWTSIGDKVPEQYTYEIETQLYRKGDHASINIEFGSDMSIEGAEKFINKLFEVGIVEPYDE